MQDLRKHNHGENFSLREEEERGDGGRKGGVTALLLASLGSTFKAFVNGGSTFAPTLKIPES